MGVLIIAKRDGFRRAVVEHSSTPTLYPDDHFTALQLAALEAEPMMVVQHVEDDPEGIPPKPWDTMTVAQLKEYAAQKQINLGDATKRDDILATIAAAEGDA